MASSKSTSDLSFNRFVDIGNEPLTSFQPIEELQSATLTSIDEALKSINRDKPKYFGQEVENIRKKHKKIKHGITFDEFAAIYLYTKDWNSREQLPFFYLLNRALRSESRSTVLSPWLSYLRLLLSGLSKLEKYHGKIYQFAVDDLCEKYVKDVTYWWWGFSSWVKTNFASDERRKRHLEKNCTIFIVESTSGYQIDKFTEDKTPEEVLLPPGTQLMVVDIKIHQNKNLYIKEIFLKEIASPLCSTINTSIKLGPNENLETNMDDTNLRKQLVEWLDFNYHDKNVLLPHKMLESMPKMEKQTESNIRSSAIFKKISGSMLGLAIGDALGAPFEFRPHSYMQAKPVKDFQSGGTWNLDKGKFTDDTSMALCLAASLIRCGDFIMYDQLVRYKWWYRYGYMSSTGKCFDIGNATENAIKNFERRQNSLSQEKSIENRQLDYLSQHKFWKDFDVNCSCAEAAGNGALMRLAPVPLFFYRDPVKAVTNSGMSGEITHGDKKSTDACRYYGALLVAALLGKSREDIIDEAFYEKNIAWFDGKPLHPEILQIAKGSYKKAGGYQEGIRGQGYVVRSLEAALWALCHDNGSFDKGVLAAVNLGDDTDTTAAIYGQLAGAIYGCDALKKWKDQLYAKNFIDYISLWLSLESDKYFARSSAQPMNRQPDQFCVSPSKVQEARSQSHTEYDRYHDDGLTNTKTASIVDNSNITDESSNQGASNSGYEARNASQTTSTTIGPSNVSNFATNGVANTNYDDESD